MAIYKCKMCGGTIEFEKGDTVGLCDSCGTKQTLPKTNDDVISNLFNRANNLRLKCEFDKAAKIYERIVEQDDSEAEAHWGLVLCKYGIEYVEDLKSFKRIPTCHRTLFEAVTTDADYLAAIDYSDAAQQRIYESEARTIDKIQKDILSIVKNEKPFDIFICYKENDENGRRTIDSTIANDIYYHLTQGGLKVFFAAITLEDKLGQEYEPYIFAALNSAKVMLVLGTKPEYYSAVWVKNEWSRFMQLMKTNRSKLLIPCYRDMDPYDLPEEFAHLQAQDMSKVGFIQDLLRGIRKIVRADEPKTTVVNETIVTGSNLNTTPLLKRAFMFLEDGAWNSADEYCEKVLDIDPENAQAYLGKLMAELRVQKADNLKDQAEPFDDKNNYQKAMRFSDEAGKRTLSGYIEHIKERKKQEHLDDIYRSAKYTINTAKTESDYHRAARLFETIGDYQDSAALAKECYEKAEVLRKDNILNNGKRLMVGQVISNYESAIEILTSVSGWKDADERINVCRQKIEEMKVEAEERRLEQERQAEMARKKAERIAKRNKKIAIIVTPIACTVIVFFVVLYNVIIPNGKYNDAVALMNAGNYSEASPLFEELNGYKDSDNKLLECEYNDAVSVMNSGNIIEAYEKFIALDGYKDSSDIAQSLYVECEVEKMRSVKAGDYVFFGTYEQDNDIANGKEDIEWHVLEVKDGKVLLISKYALDCKSYNTEHTEVTWETCTLRKWLNSDFLNTAFSADEKGKISTVTVTADKNPEYSTNPGKATQDKVFLLSVTEVNKYLSSNAAKKCIPTEYAVAEGAYVNSDYGSCFWWLRSSGSNQRTATFVLSSSDVYESGNYVSHYTYAVRPALWIDLNA